MKWFGQNIKGQIDELKLEHERLLKEKTTQMDYLQQKINDLNRELWRKNAEIQELTSKPGQDYERNKMEEEIRSLRNQIEDLNRELANVNLKNSQMDKLLQQKNNEIRNLDEEMRTLKQLSKMGPQATERKLEDLLSQLNSVKQ